MDELNQKQALTATEQWLEVVRRQVNSLQYGVVQITVHNSRVTQIDRTERVRINPPTIQFFSNQPDHWRE